MGRDSRALTCLGRQGAFEPLRTRGSWQRLRVWQREGSFRPRWTLRSDVLYRCLFRSAQHLAIHLAGQLQNLAASEP